MMRFPSLEDDYWQLESAVDRHRAYGDKFWIPSEETRSTLKPGELAKLLFQIEAENEDGSVELVVERMWVLVVERHADFYLGRLANQPAFVKPEDDVYLHIGAEIPFRAEHVIDVHSWSAQDVEEFNESVELRKWS